MIFIIHPVCPECGFRNTLRLTMEDTVDFVKVTCDLEEGGCDKDFAVSVRLKPEFAVSQIMPVTNHTVYHAHDTECIHGVEIAKVCDLCEEIAASA